MSAASSKRFKSRADRSMKATLYGLAIFFSLISASFADELIVKPVHLYCEPVDVLKKTLADHNSSWEDLSHVEWLFLVGIFAMNPETPSGLPYGDRAVMSRMKGSTGALIVFIDDSWACTPMPVPAILLKMMQDVEAGVIHHEADPS